MRWIMWFNLVWGGFCLFMSGLIVGAGGKAWIAAFDLATGCILLLLVAKGSNRRLG